MSLLDGVADTTEEESDSGGLGLVADLLDLVLDADPSLLSDVPTPSAPAAAATEAWALPADTAPAVPTSPPQAAVPRLEPTARSRYDPMSALRD